MNKLLAADSSSVELESWQPDGVTIHEGDPNGHGFTLFDNGAVGTGFFTSEPSKTTYELERNEIIYVLEGEVTIELDNGSKVDLRPGMLAFLPQGHTSTWTFHSHFREVWFEA